MPQSRYTILHEESEVVSGPLSVYLHIPFCTTKCTYCAFNTYTNLEHLIPAFVDALCREIEWVGESASDKDVVTVFFGGGTPSLLTPVQFENILSTLRRVFNVAPDAEITLETNPNDLSRAYAKGLRGVGFNRISIGMQSANPRELQLFRRRHDVDGVSRAVSAARSGGFANINLDLIYGIPEQTLDDWRNTLYQALALRPTHISLYALGIEEDTPMETWLERGMMPAPDDDLAADMYLAAEAILAEYGFEQYEISNWSLPGYACQHNLQYWRNLPYVGVGPGAHGFAGGVRYSTELSPHRYIRTLLDATPSMEKTFPLTPVVAEWTRLDRANEISETLLMGLRLIHEGISLESFRERFGIELLEVHGEVFEKFAGFGLVEVTDTHVRLTSRGRLLSNVVFRELV